MTVWGEKIEVNNLIRMAEHFSLCKQTVQIMFSSTLPKTSVTEHCWKQHMRSGLLQQAYYVIEKFTIKCLVRRQDMSC